MILKPIILQHHQNYNRIDISQSIKSKKECIGKTNQLRQFVMQQSHLNKITYDNPHRHLLNSNRDLSKRSMLCQGNNYKNAEESSDMKACFNESTNDMSKGSMREPFRINRVSSLKNMHFNKKYPMPMLPKIKIGSLASFPTTRDNNDQSKDCSVIEKTMTQKQFSKSLDFRGLFNDHTPKKIQSYNGHYQTSIKKKRFKINHNQMTENTLCGTKQINQDCLVALNQHFNLDHFDIMGVFDGHGLNGHYISSLAKKVFESYFSHSDLFYIPRKFSTTPFMQSLKSFVSEEEIYQKLIANDYKILRECLESIEEKISSSDYETDFSGSTACSVFVIGNHVLCANIGDSRAIIVSDNGKTIKTLSVDHKPESKKERERIIKTGGEVKRKDIDGYDNDNGNVPFRIWCKESDYPGLAMSRTLGDFCAKKIGVIAEAEIIDYPITEDDMYIIVGSDGLWELTNEEVANEITPYYSSRNINEAINVVTNKAKEKFLYKGTYVDDISSVLLFLNTN